MRIRSLLLSNLGTAMVLALSASASSAEPIGSAVGVTPAAQGTASGVLSLGDNVVRDETVRTGPDGLLEIKFRDGTHLGLDRSSSVKLDKFVYSVDTSGDKVVLA